LRAVDSITVKLVVVGEFLMRTVTIRVCVSEINCDYPGRLQRSELDLDPRNPAASIESDEVGRLMLRERQIDTDTVPHEIGYHHDQPEIPLVLGMMAREWTPPLPSSTTYLILAWGYDMKSASERYDPCPDLVTPADNM